MFVLIDRGVAFPQAATVTRAAADEIPQIFGPISGLYQLFIPYKNDEVNENGIPVQLQISPFLHLSVFFLLRQ